MTVTKMKLLFVFVLFVLGVCIINGQNEGDGLYVNMIPSLEGCNTVPFGIGYSFAVGKCLNDVSSFLNPTQSYDFKSYFVNVTFNADNSTVTLVMISIYDQQNCSIFINTETLEANTCTGLNVPFILSFDGKIKGDKTQDLFYLITVSKEPELPDDSYIYSIYTDNSNSSSSSSSSSSTEECEINNLLYATTISNDLEIEYSNPKDTTQTFSCNKNFIPSVEKCLSSSGGTPKCSTSYTKKSCTQSKINTNYFETIQCSH